MPPPARRVRRSARPTRCAASPMTSRSTASRRLVNERRFALGVQLIDRRRDPLEVAEGYARVAEGALHGARRSRRGRVRGSPRQIRRAASWSMLGLGRLGGCALTHASDLDLIYLYTAPAGHASNGAQAARPERLFQPAGEPGDRRAQRPDRRRAALRGRHPASARRAPRACWWSRSTRSSNISARKPGRGSIWRCAAPARCSGRRPCASARPRSIDAILRMAARPGEGRAPTRRRCAPRWSATSRRRAARRQARAGRAGRPRIRGPRAPADPPSRPRSAARSGARSSSRRESWSMQILSMR